MNRRNSPVVILAIVLMAAGFLGVLAIGQVVNPPPASIAVAIADIPVGTVLSEELVAMDEVHMDSRVLAVLVQSDELKALLGGVVVEPIHALQPIAKAAIAAEGNPATVTRLALGLSDPDMVAMVIPVDPTTSPDAIVEGDRVDLSFGVGSLVASGERLSTEPTPSHFVSNGLEPLLEYEATEHGQAAASAAEPLLMLPVAKRIVSAAQVLAVIRDVRSVPSETEDGQLTTAQVAGEIRGLVVAIPRDAQELVQFAVDNGHVRVALLSAAADDDGQTRQPTLGMTWNDLVALVRMEREQALQAGLPDVVLGPGAHAVEATLQAKHAATQVARATQTPEPDEAAT